MTHRGKWGKILKIVTRIISMNDGSSDSSEDVLLKPFPLPLLLPLSFININIIYLSQNYNGNEGERHKFDKCFMCRFFIVVILCTFTKRRVFDCRIFGMIMMMTMFGQ
jgi:hypothetical protein